MVVCCVSLLTFITRAVLDGQAGYSRKNLIVCVNGANCQKKYDSSRTVTASCSQSHPLSRREELVTTLPPENYNPSVSQDRHRKPK